MTAMKAKSILPIICQLHLSKQHIMITSVSQTFLTVSLHYQKEIQYMAICAPPFPIVTLLSYTLNAK